MPATKKANSGCYCETGPIFHSDYEFTDNSGFECQSCGSNVWYK